MGAAMTSALSYRDLVDLCAGKWGKVDVTCPFCGPACKAPVNRKRKVLRIWREDRFASYNCARCNVKGGAGDGSRPSVVPFKPRAPKPETPDLDALRRHEFAKEIWKASAPLGGTLGETYFVGHRRLDIRQLDLDHCLRWHEPRRWIVARMTHPQNAEIMTGIHRIFLNPDASKIERKMLGAQGVIRLSPDEAVTEGLGIAEGIEKSIAIMLSGWRPVWCATSACGISKFPPLAGIEALTIFRDDEPVGIKAARDCAEVWSRSGHEVFIADPKDALP